jgi:hypothetical protein
MSAERPVPSVPSKLAAPTLAASKQSLQMSSIKQATIEHKIVDGSREHLGGEEVVRIFRGQTGVSPVLLPLIGSILFRPRTVIVTQTSIVTVEQRIWSQSTVRRMVSRHRCGSVPIAVGRWGLRIGKDAKIFASLTTIEDMQHVAQLASQPTP